MRIIRQPYWHRTHTHPRPTSMSLVHFGACVCQKEKGALRLAMTPYYPGLADGGHDGRKSGAGGLMANASGAECYRVVAALS